MVEKQKNSPKSSVVNFYWRKLLFFASVFVVGIFFVSTTNYYKADVTEDEYRTFGMDYEYKVEIMKDGVVLVDGKKIAEKVNYADGKEEIRLPLVENPGVFYSSLKINLILPSAVAYNTDKEVKVLYSESEIESYVKDSKTIVFNISDVSSNAVVSVIAKMPKGTINFPFPVRIYNLIQTIKSSYWIMLGIALPAATLIFMFLFIAYQVRRQKVDMPKEESDAPPMALPPAVVGVLYHQKVGPREIAATLIDLALRGDIFILDRERDFAFAKNRFDKRLLSFEKILLSKIFKQDMVSDRIEIEKRINNHLYSKKISLVTSGIYVLATRLGYFKVNPQKIHLKYSLVGLGIFFSGLAGFGLSLKLFINPPFIVFFWVGMMLSGLVVTFTAKNIPIRTVLGHEALSNWLAFKNYLSNKEKIPFSYESQELFHKYLPYAMVLDCEVAWAKRFSEQNFILPDWFVSDRAGIGLQDFCLTLFPIVSYVARSLAAIREPGFE